MSFKLSLLSLIFCFTFNQVFAGFEAIEFVKTKNWKLEKLGNGVLELHCVAVFYNPNSVKAKLKHIDLDVSFNNTKAGTITKPDGRVHIKKKHTFEIPLAIKFSPETNSAGYFSGFLTAFSLQDFIVKIEGFLKIRAMGLPLKIKVNTTEDVNLKQLITD